LNNDRLFIGSRTGMLVYELTNPAQPTYLSSFMHASACDPVVVEGTTAYVTLRAGTVCEGTTNALEVIDIADIKSPKMIRSYQMFGPYGLGIDDGTLFVCDGDAGLKVYDATDPNRITDHLLAHFDDIDAFDVIPLGGVLMLIGADGLFQYDYSDLTNLKLLSRMKVVKD